MKNSRKKLFSTLFFFAVLILTAWYVFHDENLTQVVHYLSTADLRYVIPAVGFVIAFILGESVVIHYLLKSLGSKVRFSHCALYSFIGFFYSAITPSASGGQPMQVVAMRRDGIPASISAVVLALVTIAYKLVLVLLGLLVLVFRPEPIIRYLEDVEGLMYLGLLLNVAFITFLLLVVFSPTITRNCLNWLLRIVNRIRPHSDPERLRSRLEATIDNYNGTADFFREHPGICLNIFVITLVQRLCLFSVVWFTYQAFGLYGKPAWVVIGLYAMISVAVDMLPLPGGMGISETLFLEIFEPIFSEAMVVPAMLVARGISYYTQLAISAIMTGLSQILLRKKK